MKVLIKRVDPSLPLPQYKTKGSVGFDFSSRQEIVIAPQQIALIPVNVIIQTPPGYMLLLASRSSLPLRKGLMLANGVGIVDQDYAGQGDEIKIQVYNFSKQKVTIERGERIAQGVFVKIVKGQWQEVKKMGENSRGGFGSTG